MSATDPGRVLFVYMKGVNISWVVVNMRLLVTIVPIFAILESCKT